MKVATVHDAKTNLSKLIQRAERGEEVIITRGKKPVARLIPVQPAPGKRVLGLYRGEFELAPDFFEPLPAGDLDVWE